MADFVTGFLAGTYAGFCGVLALSLYMSHVRATYSDRDRRVVEALRRAFECYSTTGFCKKCKELVRAALAEMEQGL